ncbi:sacsin N-terminal ATP-binding-like domain-containing protein [Anditalea andensis]|uniref:Protein NO VEIN C-terminal domain-containing protein n=1 Tax=Anditalea andensis TaxID=1048983 RepID=A0A074KQL3_9BACT|nr:hypothetical protein [Anditalea andensis]KEO72231.1 hypothetical protein EL17_18700 [Anditalea andensis]
MNQIIQINRDEILKQAQDESELSDLKQHADKMIRGFENFNNFSSNRAIWEMVQNACDLTKECEVLIDYSNNNFSFTHNGRPFTTKALISLIKQVSGKYGEDSDISEVGKYGTGFLTTHTFGRKFLINSILEANNAFFEIKDFLIDRSPKEWKELSNNIRTQKNNVYKLITEGAIVFNSDPRTTFTYLPETEQEHNYIAESSQDLEDYVPLVLTINDRLKKVTILDKSGTETTFIRTNKQPVPNEYGINLFKIIISKNGYNKVLYSILDTEDEIEIILPINEQLELFEFPERIARLFLYYPLVGSEKFGLNFIINCNKFLPTEPRDGIHLKSNKDQVKDQEQENRRIVEKASQMIFNFLNNKVLNVPNPLLYAKINFKRNSDNGLLNEYFEELQATWTEHFKSLPIVETVDGFKSVSEIVFFDQDLLNSSFVFNEIYELVSIFHTNIPVKNNISLWSRFVSEWTNKDVHFISHQDLIEAISEEHLSAFNKTCLIKYYKNLIEEGKKNFFADYTLLPNLDGKFCLLSTLLIPKDLTSILFEMGKVLIPHSMDRLVHEDFRFDFNFEKFTRKDFSTNVKLKLDEMQASNCICKPQPFNQEHYNYINLDQSNTLDYTFFITLLNYCKLNNSLESNSKPAKLAKIISRYYGLEDNLIYLPNLDEQEENLDIRSSRKILVKVFFNLIEYHNNQWVSSNIPLLLEIANNNEDSLKEAYSEAEIYPNQIDQLKATITLKRDIDVSDEVKDLYDKVTKDEIRSHLVYKQFNEFVDEDRFITNKYLALQIEDCFFDNDIYKINEHPFKDDILKIISKLREKYYAELFPRLDDKKANLMLDIVTNENTKDDIFSIVTLKEHQLKKLGLLIQNKDFEAILDKAENVIQLELEKQSDFRHKYEIGTNIENLILQRLSSELQSRVSFNNSQEMETSDVQGGQDIVISLDGVPIYFIEVKSRWNSKSSVSMSKLQLQRAVEENDRFALCSVDISHYSGINDRYKLPIEDVIPLTKFITNIGDDIKPLVNENLVAEKNYETSIHLIDYRGIIPQEIINKGYDFEKFVDSLSSFITKISLLKCPA